jgi:transcriptional regulator with XRE-family HTH domain
VSIEKNLIHVETAEKIRKILLSMSQVALAEKLGITQSSVSLFAVGRNIPGPATCLALAGVCPQEDVDYWIEQSTLSRQALATISRALHIEVQAERLSGEERALLDWWRGAQNNPMERGIKATVEALLVARTRNHGRSGGTDGKRTGRCVAMAPLVRDEPTIGGRGETAGGGAAAGGTCTAIASASGEF